MDSLVRNIHTTLYIPICVYLHMYMCIFMYVYVYNTYTYTCLYIYNTYTYLDDSLTHWYVVLRRLFVFLYMDIYICINI